MTERNLYNKNDPSTTVGHVIRMLDEKGVRDPDLKLCSEALRRSECDREDEEYQRREKLKSVQKVLSSVLNQDEQFCNDDS